MPTLQKGDKIGIVSTARKISAEELAPFEAEAQARGFTLQKPKNLHAVHHQMAGTPAQRAANLQELINDPELKMILCARGGYGTVQVVDLVDFAPLLKHPKWIAGYSDITVLHSHLHQVYDFPTLHCTMPIDSKTATKEAVDSLFDVVQCTWGGLEVKCKTHRTGQAHGQIIGGNLSVLYSLCGSPSAMDTKGKILLLEDLDEYLYHIDRMLQNLNRNGQLKDLAGLIVGGMTSMHDNAIPYGQTAEAIIKEAVQAFDFPVVFDFPCGHLPDNRALPLGIPMQMEVQKGRISLKLNE